jgi:hypothetical protein
MKNYILTAITCFTFALSVDVLSQRNKPVKPKGDARTVEKKADTSAARPARGEAARPARGDNDGKSRKIEFELNKLFRSKKTVNSEELLQALKFLDRNRDGSFSKEELLGEE